jgi:plastocyanin
MRWVFAAALLLLGTGPASASRLVVHFSDEQGKPVSDAVVTLEPESTVAPVAVSTKPASVTHIIDQRDETFIPYVQIFRPGDSVLFRNSDTTRHHVYSFSDVGKFQFMLRPGQSSPAIVLGKSGITAVGCNIHDQMIAYLYVSSESEIALSDKDGDAVLGNVPAGRYTAHVWHPQLNPGQAEPTQSITLAGGVNSAKLAFKLSLLPDPRELMDSDHANN